MSLYARAPRRAPSARFRCPGGWSLWASIAVFATALASSLAMVFRDSRGHDWGGADLSEGPASLLRGAAGATSAGTGGGAAAPEEAATRALQARVGELEAAVSRLVQEKAAITAELAALKQQQQRVGTAVEGGVAAKAQREASPPLPLPPPPPALPPALPPPVPLPAPLEFSRPLLIVGIPTIRRGGDLDYLSRALQYLYEQAGSRNGSASRDGNDVVGGVAAAPIPLQLRVVVMDNTRSGAPPAVGGGGGTEPHAAFAAARSRLCSAAQGGCSTRSVGSHAVSSSPDGLFVFASNGRPRDPDGADEGNANVPGVRVREQTRDVADLLALVHELYGSGGLLLPALPAGAPPRGLTHYMFLEDDFRTCPSALAALAYALARASAEFPDRGLYNASSSWNALRLSYGLNGGVVRGGDVPALSSYLREHARRRPPDHLFVEWFAGEREQSAATKAGRPHVAFRYNLLEHFGRSSSLRPLESPRYALCYDELNDGVVFEVEAYKPLECGHDDVWPCWPRGDARYAGAPLPGPNLNFAKLHEEARKTTVQTWVGQLPPPQPFI